MQNANTPSKAINLGFVSFLGLLVFLIGLTFWAKLDYSALAKDLLSFFSGESLSRSDEPFSKVIIILAALSVISALIAVAIAFVKAMFSGQYIGETNGFTKEEKLFKKSVLLVVAEELFARFLFLGLLLNALPQSKPMFYFLLVLGNAIWSFAGLEKYMLKDRRRVTNPLIQFVSGFFFAYIFIRFGFWIGVLGHLTLRSLLYSLDKSEKTKSDTDWKILAFWTLAGVVLGGWMYFKGLGFEVLLPWLNNQEQNYFLSFWDYLVLLLMLDVLATLFQMVFMLDGLKNRNLKINKHPIFYALAGSIHITIVLYLTNWLLGYVVSDFITRLIIANLFLGMVYGTKSGSGFTRVWLTGLPNNFISLILILALGFWPAMLANMLCGLVTIWPVVWKEKDEYRLAKQPVG